MHIGFNFNGTLVGPGSATPLPGVIQRLDELPASARLFITMNEVGMLRQARRDLGRLPSLYIGGRGFDQRAAADANVRFLHVDTWRHQGLAGVPNVSTW